MRQKPSLKKRTTRATPPVAGDVVLDAFCEHMAAVARLGASWPGVVGVSGGSDSTALMLLLAAWSARLGNPPPIILTVDHGLRKGSAADAKRTAERARSHGLEAHILRWAGEKPDSDIEASAREARHRLMGAWCSKHGVSAIYLAHTLEDQAETFLLRLARGSGLDGLSAMRPVSLLPSAGQNEILLVRPLLSLRRAELRGYLARLGESWIDDPMNDDPRFARVRIRAAWPDLETLGLSPQRLADAAAHLGRAREALEDKTESLLARISQKEDTSLLIDSRQLALAPREIGLRALATALMRVSGQAYRPRFERLERLYGQIVSGGLKSARTLHGCRIGPVTKRRAVFGAGTLEIQREPRRRDVNSSDIENVR